MFASMFKHSNKELLPPGPPPMWTCSFQHGENFVGNVEKLSRAEIRRRIGLASTDNPASEQKAADDWLAAFAKKSQEALAKRDAVKRVEPRPDDKALIAALARKDHT